MYNDEMSKILTNTQTKNKQKGREIIKKDRTGEFLGPRLGTCALKHQILLTTSPEQHSDR